MCEAAFARGFSTIGFSSHAPITKKTGIESVWHMKEEKLNEYIDTVLAARKRWKGKLSVYLGLEVDYIQGLCSPADDDIQALPLDYTIGSIHYVPSPKNGEPFNLDTWPEDFGEVQKLFENDGKAICNAYYDTYHSLIRAGGCDIMGHLDLIKKNNDRYGFFSPGDTWYKDILTKTADLIALVRDKTEQTNKNIPVVEVNTSCLYRAYCTEPYPSPDMLTLLKERSIPLVLNADAHTPDHLGACYDAGCKAMQQAGYSTMVLFEGRENGKAIWRETPIYS
jgi:histidinol-phosphatase (PHP family)